jgi:hypothetical protein
MAEKLSHHVSRIRPQRGGRKSSLCLHRYEPSHPLLSTNSHAGVRRSLQDSDITYYGGELKWMNIKRGYTQGCWSLALRWLGGLVEAAEAALQKEDRVGFF